MNSKRFHSLACSSGELGSRAGPVVVISTAASNSITNPAVTAAIA